MHFADKKDLKQFNCNQCADVTKKQRKCQMAGFENLKMEKSVDQMGIKVGFCPGKATWFEDGIIIFSQCYVAMTTGLLPSEGSLENQSSRFTEVFPFFVERWEARKYNRIWSDVSDFAGKVFEQIGKMFGSKK